MYYLLMLSVKFPSILGVGCIGCPFELLVLVANDVYLFLPSLKPMGLGGASTWGSFFVLV